MSPIPGAIVGTAVLFALYAVIVTVHNWYCKARLWDRYARACGGAVSAMQVLVAAEKLDDHLHRGFKAAKRYGWLERFL